MDYWQPLAVALVTSGSRGNRLLFYHRGEPWRTCEEVKDVLSELPPRTLAEALAPSSIMVGHKFELIMDEWKFVGHPFSVQSESLTVAFNVVFVLQSFSTAEVVSAYDHLSHLIGSAIVHEEKKCDFLKSQVTLLMQLLEETETTDPSSDKILQESSLARSLHSVLCCLQEGEPHVCVKVNDWSEVNILMQCGVETEDVKCLERGQQCVRSYSSLLLLEGCKAIASCLPPSCNPALHRMLRILSPMKSLQMVSLDADIPLAQVLHFASHLVHWGKALPIYPLSESNVYITSPSADTTINSEISRRFSEEFPRATLAELLSHFSLPLSLGELKLAFQDERVLPMVVWLLQHRQITQLHTYVYLVPVASSHPSTPVHPPSSPVSSGVGSDHTSSETTTTTTATTTTTTTRPQSHSLDSGHLEEEAQLELRLLEHLSQEEQQSVLHTTAATDIEDLEQFIRLAKYFHGSHHLEEIMLIENIPRSQLLTLIDKFSEVLVTCILPEHSLHQRS